MPRYWDSIDPRLWREQKDRAKGVVQQYSSKNKKLFSRELLEKISKILTDCREGDMKAKFLFSRFRTTLMETTDRIV